MCYEIDHPEQINARRMMLGLSQSAARMLWVLRHHPR